MPGGTGEVITTINRGNMYYRNIVWDWNGTVVDDVGIALDAVNDMLRRECRPQIDLEQYRKAMNTPILLFYQEFFDLEKTSFAWMASYFHEYYAAHCGELALHAGVSGLLVEMDKRGCRQIVLSSSRKDMIEGYAAHFAVKDYFEAILGADDLLAGSKVERAVEYFTVHGIRSEETIMIGDTVHDFEVASELGVDCILLDCGHDDRESLEHCGCPVCHDMEGIKTFIETSGAAPLDSGF